jgi:hypothetical protein
MATVPTKLSAERIKDLKNRHNPKTKDFAEKLFKELYPQKVDFYTFNYISGLYAPLLRDLLQEEAQQIAFLQQFENYVKSNDSYSTFPLMLHYLHTCLSTQENTLRLWLDKYALPESKHGISELLDWMNDHRDDSEEDLES